MWGKKVNMESQVNPRVEDDMGMSVGLMGVQGEEQNCGFLGREGEFVPLSSL